MNRAQRHPGRPWAVPWILAAAVCAWTAGRAIAGPLDCSGALTYVLAAAGEDTTINADTSGGDNQASHYGCNGWNEGGPEHIILLDIQQELNLNASLSTAKDLDLFLLRACHSDSCLVAANLEFTSQLTAGQYVLVTDGYGTAAGPFSLRLRTYPAGIPQEACDGTKPLACLPAGIAISGNLFGQPNLLVTAPCNPFREFGGEAWYRLDLAAGATVTATLSAPNPQDPPDLDGSLWLFSGCGPQAECVAFTDAETVAGTEELQLTNGSGADRTYFLAVDSFRPAPTSYDGEFNLTVTCEGASEPAGIQPAAAEAARYLVCEQTTWPLQGNLFRQPGLVTSASCSPFLEEGGERWYALSLPDNAQVTAILQFQQFDGALWVFDGCGPDATCVAAADAGLAGATEQVTFSKGPGTGHTFYLAVDSSEDTDGAYEAYWDFDLTISCQP